MGYFVTLWVPLALPNLVCPSSLGLGDVCLFFDCRERCRVIDTSFQIVSLECGRCDWFCKLVGVFCWVFDGFHGYRI
jgi:hypothetical protein